MRELKILLIIIILSGITYIGIEPYAHYVMSAKVKPANFDFEKEDMEFIDSLIDKVKEKIKISKKEDEKQLKFELERLIDEKKELENMWQNANIVMSKKGDKTAGKEAFLELGCSGCHKIMADEIADAGFEINENTGFINPDLSLVGILYDEKFLAALVLNPALAMKNNHKFNDENPHPMSGIALEDEKISDDEAQQIADLLAYLKDIANKTLIHQQDRAKEILATKNDKNDSFVDFYTDKQMFLNACGRCHDMAYDDLKPFTKNQIDEYIKTNEESEKKEKISIVLGDNLLEYAKNYALLNGYMGQNPPDLSMIIRARDYDYLNNFLNNPQKLLPNTAMPRVGLNQKSQENVMKYLEQIGDSKKDERKELGIKIMIYFAILAFFAWLWKRAIWKDLE